MQGITKIGNSIYAVEQGPRGGDEINYIVNGKNYGYPKVSFGSHYNGNPYPLTDSSISFELPMYTFKPSVASSDIIECPCNLAKKYKPFDCALISSLRGQSIFVALIDPKKHSVLSLERLDVNMRIREFLKVGDDRVFVSTDGFGVYELKFSNLEGVSKVY
jgi:glucose/arabinose dehydrogenase